MYRRSIRMIGLILSIILFFSRVASPQSKPDASPAPTNRTLEDYPRGEVGILIQTTDWTSISPEGPSKTRAKRGWAAALSYGAVPANVVSEYPGAHASVQVASGKVLICICGSISLPGPPAIVRLHPKKGARELNGGRLQPFRGKLSEAQQSDLVLVDISYPQEWVSLVQSTDPLPPGEYALMLGTQNMSIFPFTVTDKSSASSASSEKH